MNKHLATLCAVFVILAFSCSKSKNPGGPGLPGNTDDLTVQFSAIPGGTFQMGDTDGGWGDDVKPVHTVTLPAFSMSKYEITNVQYAAFLNKALAAGAITVTSEGVTGKTGEYSGKKYTFYLDPYLEEQSYIRHDDNGFSVVSGHELWPVSFVTWYGAKAFALYYGYDLPTEAEWEYACRGGKQYRYGTDDGAMNASKANFNFSDKNHPIIVGSYPPNPFNLFDMNGNVAEWVNDWYGPYLSGFAYNPSGVSTGTARVIRGGAWNTNEFTGRSYIRYSVSPESGTEHFSFDVGFRVVRRSLQPSTTYSLTGKVLESSSGLSGVSMHLAGAFKDTTITTDSTGSYSFTGLPNGWSFTLTPSKNGYTFSPATTTVVTDLNTAVQNFYAAKNPNTPTTLTAAPSSPSQVNLTWHDTSTDEQGFRIEMKEWNGSYAEIGTVTENVTTYTATGLSPGTEHTFRVRAYKGTYIGTVYSPYTEEKTARTQTGGGADPARGIRFVSIPGSTFRMGQSGGGSSYTVTLSGYEMSETEITNAQYAQFLNDALKTGNITPSASSVKGRGGAYGGMEYIDLSAALPRYPDARCWIVYSTGTSTFNVVSGHENWPVVWVTWYGAKAFALLYGLDLPTEAEWQYACGGGKQYQYGTNDGKLSGTQANYGDYGPEKPVETESFPANPLGLYDMSGNVWEWCHDWYGSYPGGAPSNPSGGTTGSFRVLRGGGWGDFGGHCAWDYRNYDDPGSKNGDRGFRIVRRVSPQNY